MSTTTNNDQYLDRAPQVGDEIQLQLDARMLPSVGVYSTGNSWHYDVEVFRWRGQFIHFMQQNLGLLRGQCIMEHGDHLVMQSGGQLLLVRPSDVKVLHPRFGTSQPGDVDLLPGEIA